MNRVRPLVQKLIAEQRERSRRTHTSSPSSQRRTLLSPSSALDQDTRRIQETLRRTPMPRAS